MKWTIKSIEHDSLGKTLEDYFVCSELFFVDNVIDEGRALITNTPLVWGIGLKLPFD